MTHIDEFPHAIITGASSGIGKALAQQLFKDGYNLSLIARNRIPLLDVAKQLNKQKKSQQQCLTYCADVASNDSINKAIIASVNALGPPRLLITSAGISTAACIDESSTEVYQKLMQTNYFGTLYTLKAALPWMKTQPGGQVLMIASAAALSGIYGYSAYCASKFAIRGLAESLRLELLAMGICLSVAYLPDTKTKQYWQDQQVMSPITKRITAAGGLFSATAVARIMLKQLKKKNFTVTVGVTTKFFCIFHSLLYPLFYRYCRYCTHTKG